jgi:predicted Zn-dependent peptidase
LVIGNNYIVNEVRKDRNFEGMAEAVRSMHLAAKAQTEMQKVELARKASADTNSDLRAEEETFRVREEIMKLIDFKNDDSKNNNVNSDADGTTPADPIYN